jgi:hypothetical protein
MGGVLRTAHHKGPHGVLDKRLNPYCPPGKAIAIVDDRFPGHKLGTDR